MQNCLSIIITSLRDFGYSTRLRRISECWSCGMWVSPHTALVFFTFKLPATSQSNPGRSEGRAEHRQGEIKMRERFVPNFFNHRDETNSLCSSREKIILSLSHRQPLPHHFRDRGDSFQKVRCCFAHEKLRGFLGALSLSQRFPDQRW